MKVYSVTHLADITQLRFKLDSADVKLNCYMREGYDPEYDNFALPPRERWASIEFKDSREIDELIKILERFRNESQQHIGYWR